jgi:hypothetical protein
LTGVLGGNVVDAVVARQVLDQFEKSHGRKATLRDLSMVAGLIIGIRGLSGDGDNWSRGDEVCEYFDFDDEDRTA